MAANNPSITAGDIITDVEARLGTPNISADTYIPWVSYAYQKLFNRLMGTNIQAKEEFFGASGSISLTINISEYTITDSIPRFGGVLQVAIKYGATGDLRTPAGRIRTIAHWRNLDNVSTTYRSKSNPLYYIIGGVLGIIPAPPESGATAYIKYVKRPYQLTANADVIDVPYRFTYPVPNYVQARAIQKLHEDYSTSRQIERDFDAELDEVALAMENELSENEGVSNIEDSSESPINDNPFNY